MRVLGVDLAWSEGAKGGKVNETGLVAAEPSGRIIDVACTLGVDDVISWMEEWATSDTLAMVDAPLVVTNEFGQRLCETQVGQCYGRWNVSANSTNLASSGLAGVHLRERLEALGWRYDDGSNGPPVSGRVVSEVYPYTTIVGAEELGYDVERPRYKRKPKTMSVAEFRPIRAEACDGLIHAVDGLRKSSTPFDIRSHRGTAQLVDEPSPYQDKPYKHREDLLDAAICAWTGLLWLKHGFGRCQVLGLAHNRGNRADATIIAPARPEQRL